LLDQVKEYLISKAVNTAGFHINYTMKYKLNIDTLVIDGYTGTGDIQLTEGDDNNSNV
jgi:hypothetical protein